MSRCRFSKHPFIYFLADFKSQSHNWNSQVCLFLVDKRYIWVSIRMDSEICHLLFRTCSSWLFCLCCSFSWSAWFSKCFCLFMLFSVSSQKQLWLKRSCRPSPHLSAHFSFCPVSYSPAEDSAFFWRWFLSLMAHRYDKFARSLWFCHSCCLACSISISLFRQLSSSGRPWTILSTPNWTRKDPNILIIAHQDTVSWCTGHFGNWTSDASSKKNWK